MEFKSIGRIRYSPKNNLNQNWWVILDCDEQIGKYYRNLYKISTFNVDSLKTPSWKEHITIVRNEVPVNKRNWLDYNGKVVEFTYNTTPKCNEQFYWLDVYCDFFYYFRLNLGLPKNPEIPFHLTFGSINN